MNVYFSCVNSEKYQLWQEKGKAKGKESCQAWCIIGDFNAVRCASERKSNRMNNQNSDEMVKFNDFTEWNNSNDLPVVGRRFMWYR